MNDLDRWMDGLTDRGSHTSISSIRDRGSGSDKDEETPLTVQVRGSLLGWAVFIPSHEN